MTVQNGCATGFMSAVNAETFKYKYPNNEAIDVTAYGDPEHLYVPGVKKSYIDKPVVVKCSHCGSPKKDELENCKHCGAPE